MVSSRADLVFEVMREARLIVSCQTRFNPSDAEWDRWLTASSNLEHQVANIRIFVFSEGGHPTKAQTERLRAVNKTNPPTALVSPSLAFRFMSSALSFINPTIRCFSPAQLDKAFEHLGLTETEAHFAKATHERLKRTLAGFPATG